MSASGAPRDPAVTLLRALADEDRLRIVGLLALRSRDPLDLAMLLGLSKAACERHLRILRRAGLVVPDGGRVRLDTGPLRAVMAATAEPRPPSEMTPDDATPPQRRVLAAFFEGRRLVSIPAQRSKLRIVLERLAEQFERGRDYAEREVNELLRSHHPDYATLRRELVDEGLLERVRNTYRRNVNALREHVKT